MGNRGRANRTKNPLLVSAAAISRACDPKSPSRITVLRLLSDALHYFEESQLVVDEIKARAATQTIRHAANAIPRVHLEADTRFRAAHEQGARALFIAVTTALVKLPSRGGPLRRRAVDLLSAAGKAAGPAVVMQAAETVRDHILGLKRLTWSDTERGDFEVVSAMMTLAEISSSVIAGRDVAKDSIQFLMSQRVRQKCRRGDLALAIATIVQSFPVHAPPDDRMVDQLLDLCLSPSSVKQGSAGLGSALLVALIVPQLVSRGPSQADDVTAMCGKGLQSAPVATERAMWCVALARASVTARRSTTYQLHRYGNSELASKFPTASNSFNRLPDRAKENPEDSSPVAWVSNEIFQESLAQVASSAGLADGRLDSFLSIACVVRMWSQALPESTPIIVSRTFSKLLPGLASVSSVSAVVDGTWLGVLKDLKPSLSPAVFESLIPMLSDQSDLCLAAVLHVCSSLLLKFGRQCIRESGLSVEYKSDTIVLIKRAHEALDVSSHFIRMGGVRMISALVSSLPRMCSQFLTAVLQNLRIADLSLATKQPSSADLRTFRSLTTVEQELSSILGNAAALALLIEKVHSGQCSVPSALIRQCGVDSVALLRRHEAADVSDLHGVIAGSIRRRAGWGLVAALARARRFTASGDMLSELLSLWKAELGFAGQRWSRSAVVNGTFGAPSGKPTLATPGEPLTPCFDELIALSATRAAALDALANALRNVQSPILEQTAKALLGSCAARIMATQANLGIPNCMGVSNISTAGEAVAVADASGDRKPSLVKLARVLSSESIRLMKCVRLVPPDADGAELCYFIALSLGDEAQRVTGELEASGTSDFVGSIGSLSAGERTPYFDYAMTNHRPSLSRAFLESETDSLVAHLRPRKGIGRARGYLLLEDKEASDDFWMFSMQGAAMLAAEEVLTTSAAAVAAIVAEDLSSSGSLVDSLPSATLSPCLSAAVALEISRKLSRSDLAEINRALAVLQVLAKRSLAVTGGCQRTISSESKVGRLLVSHIRGDSASVYPTDCPGAALKKMVTGDGWLKWARAFCDEGRLSVVPLHDSHTRAVGIMYATRSIAAEAHRELGATGGRALWMGLMRRVITAVKDSGEIQSARQSVLHANAIAAMGALLEVVPEPLTSPCGGRGKGEAGQVRDVSDDVDEIADAAIHVLIDTIERGNADAQIEAALALSNCSHRIASASDRIVGSLLRAWAQDKGEFSAMGQMGRCLGETEVWTWCFLHIWKDMGIRMPRENLRFFSQDSCGNGACSPALVAGAAAVLSSCRLNWWTISEFCYSSVTEMSTELLQWVGPSSRKSRAAGLYGMIAVWAAKIDSALTQQMPNGRGSEAIESVNSFGISTTEDLESPTVLPVQAFSLKEPARINSAVGPFLDEILYEALAPSNVLADFDELHAAGTAAVSEIIRGAGARETCANLPRLPESLFAAIEAGSFDAQEHLLALVKSDARSRPRYWFGLCRSVCLGGDRLNFGTSKSTWDVSTRSKAVAVKVAVESIDSSFAFCQCDLKAGAQSSSNSVHHECAFGFLRKICDFAEELCGPSGLDFEACAEGCKLLQVLASRIGSCGTSWNKTDRTLREFRDVWDSCLSVMERLLYDHVPHIVVNSAGLAVSELLVCFLRLRKIDFFGSAQGKVASFLEKSVSQDLSKRFLYMDQGEEVGLDATLALVARYAKVVTALQATAPNGAYPLVNIVRNVQAARNLFLAVVGDFMDTLSGTGLPLIAANGGALVSGMVSESQLQSAMAPRIPAIVLGAASCLVDDADRIGNQGKDEHEWPSGNTVGVKIAESEQEYNSLILGCFVRVLKHEQPLPASARLSFISQSQEALIILCCRQGNSFESIREVLVSYAQWHRTAYLQFLARVSDFDVPCDIARFVMTLGLTVLRDMFEDEFDKGIGQHARTIADSITGMSKFLRMPSLKDAAGHLAVFLLDTLFHVIGEVATKGPGAVLFLDGIFQSAVCQCLSECLEVSGRPGATAQLCLSKVKNTFWYGCKEDSLPHVKISISMGATLCGILSEEIGREFVQLLLTQVVFDADEEISIPALCAVLDSHGVEKLIIKLLRNLAPRSKSLTSGNAFTFVYQLGRVGLSKGKFSVPAGLKTSIAAIRADGAEVKVINRIGLLLYSIFLSRLVQELPRADGKYRSLSLNESARFLRDLAQQDSGALANLISSLTERERQIVKLFMQSLDTEERAF